MCQLLGMNCNTPTDITISFEGVRRRGGQTDCHADGFGIAFFQEKNVRILKDKNPCASSPIADLIQKHPIKSENVIAHIRKATHGQVTLANTHPFKRKLWNENWVFAHNGHLKNYPASELKYFKTEGNTDSEWAFCYLLNRLHQLFSDKPEQEKLFYAVADICAELRQYGLLNFVLSNGKWMMAHASTLLFYIIRQAPFGQASLVDEEMTIDFSAVTTPHDRVAVMATLPLTHNEQWQQLATNELVLFENGTITLRHCAHTPSYMSVEQGLAIARQMGNTTI